MCSPSTLRRAQFEQMRGRVVAHGVLAVAADFQRGGLADLDRAFADLADVQHRLAEPLRVFDREGAGRRRDGALVADLAALLGVEVGLVRGAGRADRRS